MMIQHDEHNPVVEDQVHGTIAGGREQKEEGGRQKSSTRPPETTSAKKWCLNDGDPEPKAQGMPFLFTKK